MLNWDVVNYQLFKLMKGAENSKPKVSREFLDQLKSTPQIPSQKPKQVPVPTTNSQLPSPIISCHKNKKQEDIKEYPIEKICLDSRKPKAPSKHATIQQDSLKEKKENLNDQYEKCYPEHLKPRRKEESSLVKKARDQRISRSLIDMSIYHLLDQTSEKKVKHEKEERRPYPQQYKNSQPLKEVKPKGNSSLEKLQGKKNGIKIVNNLKQKEPKQGKEPKATKQNIYAKNKHYDRGYGDKLDHYYPYEKRDYNYYLDPYRSLAKENYAPNSHRDLYGGYGSLYENKYDGRLGGLYGFGGYPSNLDRYNSYSSRDYRNYMPYY